MAYGTDIDTLNPDHRWDFDGDALDQVGSVNGTATSIIYTSAGICRDVTNCAETNATTDDRITIPTTSGISSAQSRKAVAGWFMNTAIQPPPKRIYGEGTNATCFQFVMAYGNNVMFECVEPTNFDLQVFGPVMQPNRAYHLCGIFEGNGYGNEVRFYVDGVEMTDAEPSDRQPDTADLNVRSVVEFGDPVGGIPGTVGIGGDLIQLNACTNGKWNEWATWDEADAVLTENEVRETLFEKGALPDITISTGTEAAMQTALDAYSATERADAPLCLEIEAVSGGGDFELEIDNITFNSLASIHIQYTGTSDTLTLININGSNCSITSAPFGGSIVLKTRTTITITALNLSDFSAVEGARVYISGVGETEILNDITNVSGIITTSYDYITDQSIVGYVRQGTSSTYFQQGNINGPITSAGLTETILLIPDE